MSACPFHHLTASLTTPQSNADAPTPFTSPSDGTTTLVFAKPHEEDQPFTTFLSYLVSQEHHHPSTSSPSQPPSDPTIPKATKLQQEIRYAQTQNDNLRNEYLPLFAHVPPSIPWARIALARDPDAINLWIGNSRSVTALHKDNYENVYVQIAGQKHFVLLPPVCYAGVNEKRLRGAVYRRRGSGKGGGEEEGEGEGGEKGVGRGEGNGEGEVRGKAEEGLELVLEEGEETVPFAIWDPDKPAENATPYSALVQPMRVTLNPGDMLFLPCMWYHKVSQSCSPEGVCIAVNYW
jgi:jumonji domain-containing protein 7